MPNQKCVRTHSFSKFIFVGYIDNGLFSSLWSVGLSSFSLRDRGMEAQPAIQLCFFLLMEPEGLASPLSQFQNISPWHRQALHWEWGRCHPPG